MLIQDQFGIIQNLQTSPISQTSSLVGTFFDVSYSKMALEMSCCKKQQKKVQGKKLVWGIGDV